MMRIRWLLVVAGFAAGLIVSGRYMLVAQERGDGARPKSRQSPRETGQPPGVPEVVAAGENAGDSQEKPAAANRLASAASLQDAILHPFRFPFGRPTSLEQVCAYLRQTLKAPVVLDRAALERQQVEPENTVRLELDGVRLKTGLKLLLDQVGLTFHIVAEDNLLVITDHEGSADPAERIWSELSALHRDLHDLQDAVDDLREIMGDEKGDGPRVRKPTIIEEMPEDGGERPPVVPEKPGPPLEKPKAPSVPKAPWHTPWRVARAALNAAARATARASPASTMEW